MMDLMSSIIMEGDGVTQELLDTILINLIPAHKVGHTQRQVAACVAPECRNVCFGADNQLTCV